MFNPVLVLIFLNALLFFVHKKRSKWSVFSNLIEDQII